MRRKRNKLLNTAEEEEKFCHAEFDFQSLAITVTTLLLGFNVTGVAINVSFTGGETFKIEDVLNIGQWAGWSTLTAAIGFALSLVLYAHGRFLVGFQDYKAGTSFYRKSIMLGMLVEVMMILSTIFFFFSLTQYLFIQSTGPDICPNTAETNWKDAPPRAYAFCSTVGSDLYDVAKEKCEGKKAKEDFCKAYKLYKKKRVKPYWFGWQESARSIYGARSSNNEEESASWQQEGAGAGDSDPIMRVHVIDQLSQEKCQTDERQKDVEKLCPRPKPAKEDKEDPRLARLQKRAKELEKDVESYEQSKKGKGKEDEEKEEEVPGISNVSMLAHDTYKPKHDYRKGQVCAAAYTAWINANKCADSSVADATKCFKVCSWQEGSALGKMYTRTPTKAIIGWRLWQAEIIFLLIFGLLLIFRVMQYVRVWKLGFEKDLISLHNEAD